MAALALAAAGVEIVEGDAPLGGAQQGAGDAEQHGFARARRAREAHHLAGLYRERDRAKAPRGARGEAVRDPVERQLHGVGSGGWTRSQVLSEARRSPARVAAAGRSMRAMRQAPSRSTHGSALPGTSALESTASQGLSARR